MINIRFALDVIKQCAIWATVPVIALFTIVMIPQVIILIVACLAVGIVACLTALPLLFYAIWRELGDTTRYLTSVRKKQMSHYRLFRNVVDALGSESVVDFGDTIDARVIAASPAYPTAFHLKAATGERRHLIIPLPVIDANLVIYESRIAPDCDKDDGTVLVAVGPDGLRNVNHPFAFVRTSLDKVVAEWLKNKEVESGDMIAQVYADILQNVLDKKDPFSGL